MAYQDTSLWQRSIGNESLGCAEQRQRLGSAYGQFWENAKDLAARISAELPALTLHDERHFDALWSRASDLAGRDFLLNPLEAFVFGGAVLLHDAANSSAAYERGLAGIKETPEWGDELASQLEHDGSKRLSKESQKVVLLNTLRRLHAKQAETLAFLGFRNKPLGTIVHVLADEHLRIHLGRIVGLVAASHHWDINSLPHKLPVVVGAISGFPSAWSIQPVKIACLLRCADAIQLDQSRAPDFLYALLRLRGLSEAHWRAQNRLAAPVVDEREPEAIIFSATTPFKEEDAEAWWIAHDAVQIANRELRDSESLLRDLQLPTLAVKRVRDAESPERLAKHIMTQGWRPVSAEVKATRIDHIIGMFGGRALYGEDTTVPLRELLQNASDAVRARRAIEAPSSNYNGEITVRLVSQPSGKQKGFWLHVEDDGLGMSEGALTGPLIDFGSSYADSALVKEERPGFVAKRVKRAGRYGIGFFSVFMLAQKVTVSSRPYDRGLASGRTLAFKGGPSLRPLLLDGVPADFSPLISTRISLWLTLKEKEGLLTFSPAGRQKETLLTLEDLAAAMCPTLDCDVYVQIDDQARRLVHSRYWNTEDASDWLRKVTLAPLVLHPDTLDTVSAHAENLRFISNDDPNLGRAAVTFRGGDAGVSVIGGLVAKNEFRYLSDEYVGVIEHEPEGPKREAGPAVGAEYLAAWATEQASIVSGLDLPAGEKHSAAVRISDYGGDPRAIANAFFNRAFTSLKEVASFLCAGGELFIPTYRMMDDLVWGVVSFLGTPDLSSREHYDVQLECDVIEIHESFFYESRRYYDLPGDGSVRPSSLLHILGMEIADLGPSLQIARREKERLGTYVGKGSERDEIRNGDPVECECFVVTAKRG